LVFFYFGFSSFVLPTFSFLHLTSHSWNTIHPFKHDKNAQGMVIK
jgi:hypothetical protein